MTYEQILNAAKAELANCGGSVEIDMSDPHHLIELELYHAFCVYDNAESGDEWCRMLVNADVKAGA